jgi:hypothetical protein
MQALELINSTTIVLFSGFDQPAAPQLLDALSLLRS